MLALDPVFDTQAIFRVLLEALARPGRTCQLPVRAADAPGNPWLVAAMLTLLDSATPFACIGGAEAAATARFVRQRTAAPHVSLEQADFVAIRARALDAGVAARVNVGTHEYPDAGATLLVEVPSFFHSGATYRVSGPGATPPVTLTVDGLTEEFVAARVEVVRGYPRGFDMLLFDARGACVGLPRSSQLEELA